MFYIWMESPLCNITVTLIRILRRLIRKNHFSGLNEDLIVQYTKNIKRISPVGPRWPGQ